jgi:catechol 2,3-dioxygenase-like lactoylglutathione lyase family enzyme
MVDAIAHITVGVADLQAVFDLWIGHFGLEIVARRTGSDPGLGKLWDIPAEHIADQVLVRTPGATTGWLHFVQFNDPVSAVRDGAAATDLGPKNLDVNCFDMDVRYEQLQAQGQHFRSEIVEYRIDDVHAREVQMPGHDETNIVLIEILSDGCDIEFSPAGFGGVTSFVVVVSDTIEEAGFYRDVFDLDEVMHHRITGAAIEKAVGLPAGAALDMRLMGREKHIFGRMELISYQGLAGLNRFPLARAPALGTLHCGFAVDSVPETLEKARRAGLVASEFEDIETIFGTGHMGVFQSPAGLRVEAYHRPR